jgi:hypothetical protein
MGRGGTAGAVTSMLQAVYFHTSMRNLAPDVLNGLKHAISKVLGSLPNIFQNTESVGKRGHESRSCMKHVEEM